MTQTKRNEMDMTQGPLAPQILRFALPLILSGMMGHMFSVADVMVVGKFVGDAAQAAVTSSIPLVGLLLNLFTGLGAGVNVVVARALGGADRSRIGAVVHTSICMAGVLGVLLTLVGELFAPALLRMMDCPEGELFELALLYLRLYLLGVPAMIIYNFSAALMRAQGRTKQLMYYSVFAGVVNTVLNLLFVVGFHWDVAGVAVSTAFAHYLPAFFVVCSLMHESGSMHFDPAQLRIDFTVAKEITRIGIPAGLQSSLFNLSNVVVQSAVNSLGPVVMAGSGAATNVGSFITCASGAFYQSALTFSAQNRGAGKPERIDRALRWNVLFTVVSTTIMSLAIYVTGPWLLGIYTDDPEVLRMGMLRLFWNYVFYGLYSVVQVFLGTLRSLGYSLCPTLVALIGNCGLRVVWIATVFAAVGTPASLFMGFPATWVITVTVLFVSFLVIRPRAYAKIRAQAKETEQ